MTLHPGVFFTQSRCILLSCFFAFNMLLHPTRCLAYGSVQQVHLYEPSGHLKQSRALLQDSLEQLAEQQGKSIAVKVS
jgi:hypothetical protein